MYDKIRGFLDHTPTRIGLLALLGLLGFAVFTLIRDNRRENFAEPARAEAQRTCAQELGAAACEDLIAQHHDKCSRIAYKTPKYADPSFDAGQYIACVTKGPDKYYEDRRRERATNQRDNPY